MLLSVLTDHELVHFADVSADPLTATDLQTELLKRFAARLGEFEAREQELHEIEIAGIQGPDALREQLEKATALDELVHGRALLQVLIDHDIDNPVALQKILERDARLGDVLTTLAKPLADLQALATP